MSPASTVPQQADHATSGTDATETAQAPKPELVGILAILRRVWRFLGYALAWAWGIIKESAIKVLAFCEHWLLDGKHAPHGLAVTRIMFGIAGLGILLSNWSTRLYSFGPGSLWNGQWASPTSDFPDIWLFSVFRTVMPNAAAYTAMYLLVMLLAVLFTLGWRFKLVLPIYFVLWVSLIEAQDALGDQGDNMYRIALILLFFADPCQRWSLDTRRRARAAQLPAKTPWLVRVWKGEPLLERFPGYSSLFHNLALVALTAQVCFVYASGALYKAGGAPWSGGWATYDPLMTVQFGTWPELSELATTWGPTVTIAAWGSIILQMCFPAMLLHHVTRVIALIGIMGFHLGIALLMGLPWFSLTMIAIDFIFITEKTWSRARTGLRSSWARAA